MNKVILMGRLTKDPEVRYSAEQTAIARYTLAVDRRTKDASADFIPCVAFGRSAEFAEKYLHKGIKIVIVGRIQTGSYTNRDGQKVYTTDVIVEEQEFAESKSAQMPVNAGTAENQGSNARENANNAWNNTSSAGNSASNAGNNASNVWNNASNAGNSANNAWNNGSSAWNNTNNAWNNAGRGYATPEGFMSIPDSVDDDDLPFN